MSRYYPKGEMAESFAREALFIEERFLRYDGCNPT